MSRSVEVEVFGARTVVNRPVSSVNPTEDLSFSETHYSDLSLAERD